MKFKEMVVMVFAVGVGGSMLFFSCGRDDDDSSESAVSETTTSEGKDVTQDLQIGVTGAMIDFAATSFDAGSKLAVSTTRSPTEFTSNPDVTGASIPVLAQASDANGQPIEKAKKVFTVTFDFKPSTNLTPVEQADANVCVLGLGNDRVLRKWKLTSLKVDTTTKKIQFPTIWLGHYQALYCGSNFEGVAEVDSKGESLVSQTAANACNYVDNHDYGYCMSYYGSNFVGTTESIAELQKSCETQKGVFGVACATAEVVGICAYGFGTKQEVAWTWYESSIAFKDLAAMKADCAEAQGKWFEAGAYTPTPDASQK